MPLHVLRQRGNINAWLREIAPANLPKHKLVGFHELNLWYFGGDAAARRTGAGIRRTDFGGF